MSLFKEFRSFVLKGNAVDLAVGVLIGASFGGFVTAFTKGIIEPIISAAGGTPEVSLKVPVGSAIFDVGLVINALISLLITGAVLFFIFVKPMNRLKALGKKEEVAAPLKPDPEVELLTEIRDLLKQQGATASRISE